jgi:sugar phosphate isomerase/epimerase
MFTHEKIRIGTLVAGHPDGNAPRVARYLEQILPHGFESISLTFWQTLGSIKLRELAGEVNAVLNGTGVVVSNIGIFGNPLGREAIDQETVDGWELMFETLPNDNLGLQWEPCHQLVQLIDPIPTLRKWVHRVFSVHGKDATVNWDLIREFGIHGNEQWCHNRTPGFGDSNWSDIITILRQAGYEGSIDIEGWHDPVYKEELEMTGQIHALNHLKQCRGGTFVPNPA